MVVQLPEGVTESDFLDAVSKACDLLAKTFAFGYYDSDDIRQEAFVFAAEGLSRYDPTRPLANFVYTHIKNRLINFRRDRFHRNDPPCLLCGRGGRHADGVQCDKFISWKKRNSAKQSLMRPIDLSDREDVDAVCEDLTENLSRDEILSKIDMGLPTELRGIYLRMLSGEAVPKSKRDAVAAKIREILS
jgi:DNA-directed RNA polymerase specialized sigma24 family protein